MKHLLLCLALLITACGGGAEDAPSPRTTAEQYEPAAGQYDEKIKLKTPEGERIAEFKLGEDAVKVEFGPEGSVNILKGKLRDDGKRKYEIEGGMVVAEVKGDAGSFKLRGADGALRWKVKLADDKIKISDNEENANPYELKVRESKVDVEEDGAEIGKVNFYSDRGKMKVKDAGGVERYESNTERYSAAYGVLLMERIPETERFVIIAELLARGR